MSVLIFIDQAEGHIKKASFEVLSYGAKLAEQVGTTAEAVALGSINDDLASLGKYGVKKIHHVKHESLNQLDSQVFCKVIAEVAQATGAKFIIFSNNVDGKAVAPRLSARLKAGLVAGAIALPDTKNGFVVRKNVFSGKAFANVAVKTDIKIIAVNPNAFQVKETGGTAEVVEAKITVDPPKIKVKAINKVKGEIPLSEAELVVSGGRGLKGPENWGMIEELAT